jgi:hypothetical protein
VPAEDAPTAPEHSDESVKTIDPWEKARIDSEKPTDSAGYLGYALGMLAMLPANKRGKWFASKEQIALRETCNLTDAHRKIITASAEAKEPSQSNAGTIPSPDEDPEGFIVAVRAAAEKAENLAALKAVRDTLVTPHQAKIFPPDQEAIERILKDRAEDLGQ